MGRRLISQRRGKGGPTYRSPSFRYRGEVSFPSIQQGKASVEDIMHDPGRTGLVAVLRYGDGSQGLIPAPEGLMVGQTVDVGPSGAPEVGSIVELSQIPEGTAISSIETRPGSGPKLVRAGGCYASVISHDGPKTTIQLPSGFMKTLDGRCKAVVGVVSAGGRKEKPFLKAGKRYYHCRSRNKLYPRVRGVAMNAVDHPHGGGGHQHLGRPSTVSRNAPPGRKVGQIAASRTGTGKRRSKRRYS